jgi:hypothetical protein
MTEAQMTDVKLTKPHTHRGTDYLPGDIIAVEEYQADLIEGWGAGERVPEGTMSVAAATAEPEPKKVRK